MDLTGKVALVTGSSRGIGAGIIRGLAAHGAICVVNYVADAAGRNLADAQSVAHDSGAGLVVEADVSNHARVGAAMEEITARLGGIDILVNNAGILRDRTIRKMTPDDFHAVVIEFYQWLSINHNGVAFNLNRNFSFLIPVFTNDDFAGFGFAFC